MQTTSLVSREEYFNILAKSDIKLEYHSGEIVAMAGAQLPVTESVLHWPEPWKIV